MPGAAFQRIAGLLAPEVARLRERQAQRVAGHDAVRVSPKEKLATYSKGSIVIWTAQAELLAHFAEELGFLRWWWRGVIGATAGKSRLDPVFVEAKNYGIEELTTEATTAESLDAADLMCGIAAHFAHADGILRVVEGDEWIYYALFDAPRGSRMTIPVPAARVSTAPPPPARRPMQTIPAYEELGASAPPPPQGSLAAPRVPSFGADAAVPPPPAEPTRDMMLPVAQEAAAVLQMQAKGFAQALLTVTLDVTSGKARFFVHMVSCDASGDLHSLEPSQKLFDAVATMIGEQRRRSGGVWRKLVARFRATERGASIDVKVT